MQAWYDHYKDSIADLSEIPYLPEENEDVGKKIPVPPSDDERIQYFTTLQFNADEAMEHLNLTNLYDVVGKKCFPKEYQALSLGNPPVPLSKDNSYLMAMCGAGQGFAGSVEDKDLHLQRGVVKVIEEHQINCLNGESEKQELVETTHSKMVLVTLENSGRITILE
jgi:hypothetical protein